MKEVVEKFLKRQTWVRNTAMSTRSQSEQVSRSTHVETSKWFVVNEEMFS
jgi:hypothetical protein